MVRKRSQRTNSKGHPCFLRETYPHQYAAYILAGTATLEDVPIHFHAMVKVHLELAEQAQEKFCAKQGAQIAQMKNIQERRQALARIPLPLRNRVERYARVIFEQLRRKR